MDYSLEYFYKVDNAQDFQVPRIYAKMILHEHNFLDQFTGVVVQEEEIINKQSAVYLDTIETSEGK